MDRQVSRAFAYPKRLRSFANAWHDSHERALAGPALVAD